MAGVAGSYPGIIIAMCVYGRGGRVISRHHYCNVRIWQGWQGHIEASLLQCAYMVGVAGSYPGIIIAMCVYGRGGWVISRHYYCNVRIWQGWQGHIRTSLLQCAYMAGVAGSYPDIIIAMCVYGRGGRVISRHHYCNVRIWQGWQGHIQTSSLQCAYMAGVAGSYPDIIIAMCVYGRGGRVISRHHYCNVRIWQGWQGHIQTSLLQCAYMAGVAGSYPDIMIAMCVYGRGGRVISRHHDCNVRIW